MMDSLGPRNGFSTDRIITFSTIASIVIPFSTREWLFRLGKYSAMWLNALYFDHFDLSPPINYFFDHTIRR